MARLDFYRLSGIDGYVLEVQADLMGALSTTVVVPLFPLAASPKPMTRLNPIVTINGAPYVMVTQSIATIPKKDLGSPIGSLGESRHYEVVNALDMLFLGT